MALERQLVFSVRPEPFRIQPDWSENCFKKITVLPDTRASLLFIDVVTHDIPLIIEVVPVHNESELAIKFPYIRKMRALAHVWGREFQWEKTFSDLTVVIRSHTLFFD